MISIIGLYLVASWMNLNEIFLLIKNDIHEPTLLNIISYYSEYCSDVFPWTKLANNHLKNIASISATVTENV